MDHLEQARRLLRLLQESSPSEATAYADDLLLFLQRLNDRFLFFAPRISYASTYGPSLIRSWTDRIESDPERALLDDAFRTSVIGFLDDLCCGRVPVRPR